MCFNNFLVSSILQKFGYFLRWCELILWKSIKCKRSQSRVIKMSVVVTEFMALVLIRGVFWKYLVSYLVHTVALIQLRKRLSEKWVGSPRIHLSHPPSAPNTHIYSHTHTLMLIWFEKNIRKHHHQFLLLQKWLFLLDCPLLEFLKYTLCLYLQGQVVGGT